MPLKDDLLPIIQGEVLDDSQTLNSCSKDASIFDIRPQLVVCPKDSEDIKQLARYALNHPGVSITPRSAGTDMSGGAINESIILDMTKHFNKIVDIGPDFATVQPGVYYRDFEAETLKKNLLLPCYPASRELCTVGGMVANNSAGEKTLAFGQTHEFVEKLKVVLADGNEYIFEPLTKEQLNKKIAQKNFEGEIYKRVYQLIEDNYETIQKAKPNVSKNSSGYLLWDVWDKQTFDLTQLITGSQGTLGVVTEIKFRLIKPKTKSGLLVIFLYNLNHLGEVVDKVLEFKPESFESYDDQTLKFATRFWTEVLRVIKPHNLLSLGLSFIPELFMTLKYGFPKLILMAEFTADTQDEVNSKSVAAQKSIQQFHLQSRITQNEDDARKYWVIRRESFNLFRHHATKNRRTVPFIDDIIVKPQILPEFLPKLDKLIEPYKKRMIYTVAGHVGNGNLHIIPLMDLTKEEDRAIIPELSKKVYDLVFEYKGSMSAEHNDGLIRGPYLEQMYGSEVYQLFKEIKNIFDPNGIFNPHKKVDATFEYSLEHISTGQ